MAYTITLADARTEVIHLAAIDGKTGANGRHSPTRVDALLNRTYRELLSRSGQLGLPHGLLNATGTLGGVATDEDYINLAIPAAASEVVGVDVRNALIGSEWGELDPLSWEQRRDALALCPPNGVGFWAQRIGASVSGATLTQGALAIWPGQLAGKPYMLHYVQQWTAITTDSHVFLLHEGWEGWLLNKAAMGIAQRDTNKRTNYDTARDMWLAADALLEAQAARVNRAGVIVPTPYGGVRL